MRTLLATIVLVGATIVLVHYYCSCTCAIVLVVTIVLVGVANIVRKDRTLRTIVRLLLKSSLSKRYEGKILVRGYLLFCIKSFAERSHDTGAEFHIIQTKSPTVVLKQKTVVAAWELLRIA